MNRYYFIFIFGVFLGLVSCGSEETMVSQTAVSPTIAIPTHTPSPTSAPTETATITAVATTPPPTQTPLPTIPTTATARTPTINFQWDAQADGMMRLSGASDGFRHGNYCDEGPFRWLTDTHLLLLPITGYSEWYENPEGGQLTQPVVLDVTTGDMWTTTQPPTDVCYLPVWSDALQALIETDGETLFLRDLTGGKMAEYPGGNPLHLAPSGLRLLAGKNWIDLETETIRELPIYELNRLRRPAWTADETRFFDCCLRYGNAETGSFYNETDMPGLFVSGIGVGPDYDGSPSRWLLEDQVVAPEGGSVFLNRADSADVISAEGSAPFFFPLIDPEAFTFTDLGETFSFTQTMDCQLGSYLRPAHDQIMFGYWNWEACPSDLTLVDLQTMTSDTISGYHFQQWSPNGRYAILFSEEAVSILNPEQMTITKAFDIIDATQLRDHAWSDDDEFLAMLSLGSTDLVDLFISDLANGETKTLPLPQPVTQIEWQPKQGGLSLLLLDNSIWYLPPGAETAVSLTTSLSSASDLKWSPDGTYLALINDTDLVVLNVQKAAEQP